MHQQAGSVSNFNSCSTRCTPPTPPPPSPLLLSADCTICMPAGDLENPWTPPSLDPISKYFVSETKSGVDTPKNFVVEAWKDHNSVTLPSKLKGKTKSNDKWAWKPYTCVITCHLYFWQNGQGLLGAIAVTWGWNGHKVRVSAQSLLWRRKFSCHSCQDLNSQPFDHESSALPTSYAGSPLYEAVRDTTGSWLR